MLTLEDLQAQIDESLSINSIESSYSFDFYTDLINQQRSLWLRNEYNKNRRIDPYVLQNLNCLELELVNPIDCCITVPDACKILRTKKKIPNTIELYFKKGIAAVGPADITKPRFIVIDYSRVPFVGHGRTTQKAIYTFLYDEYMYVISRDAAIKNIKYITLRGIFEDPTSLLNYVDCADGTTCWSTSKPYPINQWMWTYIKPIILQELMQKGANAFDDMNDAQDARSQGMRAAPQQQQQQQPQQ